jgi:hypothetical protein
MPGGRGRLLVDIGGVVMRGFRLTAAQLGLQAKHMLRRKKTGRERSERFCKTCGGTHAGGCVLISTTHGTRCRPDLLATVERRFQESLATA